MIIGVPALAEVDYAYDYLSFRLGSGSGSPGLSAYLPPNLYLVRATILKVWKEPKEYYWRGLLKVTAVVSGPKELLGQKFEAKPAAA